MNRDLKTSPFEETLSAIGKLRDLAGDAPNDFTRNVLTGFADGFGILFGHADGAWKQGRQLPDSEMMRMTLMLWEIHHVHRNLERKANGEERKRWTLRGEPWDGTLLEWFTTLPAEEQERLTQRARDQGCLEHWERPVPSRTVK